MLTSPENRLIYVDTPKHIFYNDVPEPLATEASERLRGQSELSFHAASGPVFYAANQYDGRRLYIDTDLDQASAPAAQDSRVANSGAEWEVKRIATSHSPFLSHPAMLAKIVVEAAEKFTATY